MPDDEYYMGKYSETSLIQVKIKGHFFKRKGSLHAKDNIEGGRKVNDYQG